MTWDGLLSIRPAGGARVILADLPWSFDNWSSAGEGKNAKAHYDCQSLDDLCAMPVEALAAPDCALFVWCTWPLMPVWDRLIRAWGFTFAGLAWEWIKFNPKTGKYAFGPGYGTRKNLEPCLLATRGNPPLRSELTFFGSTEVPAGVRSVRDFLEVMPLDCLRAARREHSRKPDEQYERIETLFAGPYVELFARCRRPGWVSWGNQVDMFEEVG